VKDNRICVITENNLGPGQLTGLLPNLFYKFYNFVYLLQLRFFLKKKQGELILVTSRNLIAEKRLPKDIKSYFYDEVIFDTDYLKSRAEAWDFADNWYKSFAKLNLEKKFLYKGINLNQLISLRLAVVVNQSVLSYYQALESVFDKEKPTEIYLFSGLSNQEKIASFLARQKRISCKVAFPFSIVPIDILIKKFLRLRELKIIWNNILKMNRDRHGIVPGSLITVATHPNHLKAIIPLIKKIKENYKTIIITDFFQTKQELKILSKGHFDWSFFLNELDVNQVKQIRKTFEGYFTKIWGEIDKSFEYTGGEKDELLFLLVKEYLKNRVKEIFPIALVYIEAIDRLLKRKRPRLIFFISDRGTLEETFSIFARKYKIPTILYSPNNVMSVDMTNKYDIADLLLITGEHIRRELLKIGHSPENIEIVGDLRFDDLSQMKSGFKREDICVNINIDPKKKIILLISLYSSDYSPVYEKKKYFQAVAKATEKINDVELLIRPHPNESLKLLNQQVKEWNIKKAKVIDNRNIYELLYLADLVIMLHSMTGFEAQVFGKPVIAVNLLKKDYQRYVPYGGSILQIDEERKLYPAILALLNEKSKPREELIRRGESFREQYLGKADGKVSQRVKKYILKLISYQN